MKKVSLALVILGLVISVVSFALFALMFIFSIGGYFENRIEADPLDSATLGSLLFFLFAVIQVLAIFILYKKWKALK